MEELLRHAYGSILEEELINDIIDVSKIAKTIRPKFILF